MRRIRGNHLAHRLLEQDDDIHPVIIDTLLEPAEEISDAWAPTSVLEAIVMTTKLIKRDGPLATKQLVKSARIANDTPANTLVDIINASSILKGPTGNNASVPDSCPNAESTFIDVVDELVVIENGQTPLEIDQIILYGEEPVIIRKKYDITTGLTLKPMLIDTIPYPAGSILAVESKKPRFRPDNKPFKIDVTDIKRATFLRLSAFALRPDERMRSFHLRPDSYRGQQEIFRSITIDDIGRTVSEALVKIT